MKKTKLMLTACAAISIALHTPLNAKCFCQGQTQAGTWESAYVEGEWCGAYVAENSCSQLPQWPWDWSGNARSGPDIWRMDTANASPG